MPQSFVPRDAGKLAFVTQTTLSVDDTAAIVAVLRARFPGIVGPHKEDICYATTNRQAAVKAIAPKIGCLLVVGSPQSSNSLRLVEVAQRAGCPTARLIEGARDIPWADIEGLEASASRRAPPRRKRSSRRSSTRSAAASTSSSRRSRRRSSASPSTFPASCVPPLPSPDARPESPTPMAVYTEVSDEELASFIASYGLGELLSFKGIAEGVENTNYIVHATQRPVHLDALREARRSLRPALLSRADGASRRARRHLPDAGARHRRAQPAPALRATGGARHVPRRLLGAPPDGRTLRGGGHVHWPSCISAARDLPCDAPTRSACTGWRPLYERFAGRAGEIAPDLAPLVEGELKFLEANWPRGLPEGVIHADLFPDNVFFLGDRLSGLIDFYFACNDALAYDIAVSLNAWCFEKDMSFNITKGQAFLRGYEEVRHDHPGGARGDADARPRARRCASC